MQIILYPVIVLENIFVFSVTFYREFQTPYGEGHLRTLKKYGIIKEWTIWKKYMK